MLRFLSTVLAVVAGLFIFSFLFVVVIISVVAGSQEKVVLPDDMVLLLDLRQEISDAPSATDMPVGLGGPALSVVGIVEALENAEADSSVHGLYIRVGAGLGLQPAQAEEVRGAIADFRSSGKFVISHAQDLTSVGLGGYYLASEADEVWMQPNGSIFAQGFGVTNMFFKRTLAKLDVSAEALHYHEYKTAMHSFLYDGPTDPQTEEYDVLLKSLFDRYSSQIATSRGMSRLAFSNLLNETPFVGAEAEEAGLVDKLGYDIDAEEAALDKAGEDAELIGLAKYYQTKGSPYTDGKVVALIQGEGPVVEGSATAGIFGGESMLAGDTVSKAILEAIDDEEVKAIVFRVNSPGGSAIASDQVWNAIERAQAAGLPVVINMSGLAASGGYWVAMGADSIVAEPTTITGSIGVVGGKFIMAGLYEKLGVSVVEQSVGGDKMFMFSDQHGFSPQEWLALREMFDGIYDEFIHKVADGRGLPEETVRKIARGRVWTGADAKAHGLVDEMGGLKTAIAEAKRLAEIDAEDNITLRRFPGEQAFWEQVFSAFGSSAKAAQAMAKIAAVLELQPTAQLIDQLKAEERTRLSPVQAAAPPMEIVH